MVPIFGAWMAPFENLGMTHLTIRNTCGTDHLAFNAVGLSGFQFIQDPVQYSSRTHHSNLDVYDQLIAADMMKNAVITAAFVYHTANREPMLPAQAATEAYAAAAAHDFAAAAAGEVAEGFRGQGSGLFQVGGIRIQGVRPDITFSSDSPDA